MRPMTLFSAYKNLLSKNIVVSPIDITYNDVL